MKIISIEIESNDGVRGAVILDNGSLTEMCGEGYWLTWDESHPSYDRHKCTDEFLEDYRSEFDKLIAYYDETKELIEFAKPFLKEAGKI